MRRKANAAPDIEVRALAITQAAPLFSLNGHAWQVGDRYLLHVDATGAEHVVPDNRPEWEHKSLTVTVVEVGAYWIVEATRVRTFEDWEGPVHLFRVVPPRGEGWQRDADADRYADKWSAWFRRRRVR